MVILSLIDIGMSVAEEMGFSGFAFNVGTLRMLRLMRIFKLVTHD